MCRYTERGWPCRYAKRQETTHPIPFDARDLDHESLALDKERIIGIWLNSVKNAEKNTRGVYQIMSDPSSNERRTIGRAYGIFVNPADLSSGPFGF